jgi:hypothetical protein
VILDAHVKRKSFSFWIFLLTAYTLIADSVAEFNPQTSVLPPQLGRCFGGVTSVITKSGTHQIDGRPLLSPRTRLSRPKNYV